jgi:hypothetical protein
VYVLTEENIQIFLKELSWRDPSLEDEATVTSYIFWLLNISHTAVSAQCSSSISTYSYLTISTKVKFGHQFSIQTLNNKFSWKRFIWTVLKENNIFVNLLPALRNDDISDDIRCAQHIKRVQGFRAWTTYGPYCTSSSLPRCWTVVRNPMDYSLTKDVLSKKNAHKVYSWVQVEGKGCWFHQVI